MLISLRDICVRQIRALLQIHSTKSTTKYTFLLKEDFLTLELMYYIWMILVEHLRPDYPVCPLATDSLVC